MVFADPEIASVGLSAEEAKAAGFEPAEGRFPFAASGRALSLNETEGWCKVAADKTTDKLLGVHMRATPAKAFFDSRPTGKKCGHVTRGKKCDALMVEGTKTIPDRCSKRSCPNRNPHKP